MQARFNALFSAIAVGLIWAFRHLPIFFIVGSAYRLDILGPYVVQVVVFSIWFSWLYNNTKGSLLVAVLFHTMEDLTLYTIFPVTFIFSFFSLPVLYMCVSGAGGHRCDSRRMVPERTGPAGIARFRLFPTG